MRLARVVRLATVVCALTVPALSPAAETEPASPAERLSSALTAMGQAQVGDEVLIAWLDQQGELPRLSGEQLARLKSAGLSDGVLLHLVRGGVEPAAAAPTLERPAIQEVVSSPQKKGAKVRVVVQSQPSVDYCELALDGALIATLGRRLEGEVAAGSRARRPKPLALHKPAVLFEGEVPPGRHVLHTGFLVSRIQEQFGDLREGRRQKLVTDGIRALDHGADEEAGTACTVGPGEVCLVTARFRKVDRSLFGTGDVYAVSYDTRVQSEDAESETQASNWFAGP